MRNAFAAELMEVARRDRKVVFLSGDIGNKLFDKYKAAYPERFYNCGVAEAGMMGAAAGLALGGLRPIVYTINSFLTTRAYEQIKIDVCHHGLPVVIVGVGGGLAYAENGATHESCEDLAIMRVLPGLKVLCPGDPYEVRACLRAAAADGGPVFMRIGKKGEPCVHRAVPKLVIGRGLVAAEGRDVCVLSAGNMLPAAMECRELLSRGKVSARVVSFHTVKPLDERLLASAFRRFKLVTTVEEHSVLGGLGGAVAEWVCDRALPIAKLLRLGAPDRFLHEAGGQEFARARCGLTPAKLASRILGRLKSA